MKILGIETSCDETAAAIIEAQENDSTVKLLSSTISTSMGLHAKTGGIIPEQAARQQIKFILPVIDQALSDAKITSHEIDAIAVTYGPGLIGSLLVGIETAKTLAYVWKKPIVPINHLIGHIYANWIKLSTDYGLQTTEQNRKQSAVDSRLWTVDAIAFPAIALIVSGGHTDLVLMKKHGNIEWLGGTRDDAAGEAFDKIGRLLGIPYPAGPQIEQLAKEGNPKAFAFPRPMIGTPDFDFSFSGLKAAVYREVQTMNDKDRKRKTKDLSASTQQAIIDVLIKKTLKAAEKYQVKSILLSGGVAANQTLKKQFKVQSAKFKVELFVPDKQLCTDNAAMIASAAFFNYKEIPWEKVTANPELYFD